LKKLEERSDFFLTYVECILGLLRYNNDKYVELVEQIAADETRDEKLREFCNDLICNSSANNRWNQSKIGEINNLKPLLNPQRKQRKIIFHRVNWVKFP